MSSVSQSEPHGQTNSPTQVESGGHWVSAQQLPFAEGCLQTPFTHGTKAKSPQSISTWQHSGSGVFLQTNWPASLQEQKHVGVLMGSLFGGHESHMIAGHASTHWPGEHVHEPIWHSLQGGGFPRHVPTGQSPISTEPSGHTQPLAEHSGGTSTSALHDGAHEGASSPQDPPPPPP